MYNLTKTEIKLLEFLVVNINRQFSIRELSKQINASYPITYNFVQTLIKKELILIEKKSKSTFCTLQHKKNSSEVLFVESLRTRDFLKIHKTIELMAQDIIDKIDTFFFIMLIFGSYASGKYKKTSDIDMLFIIQNKQEIELFENKINSVLELYPLKTHIVCVDVESFKEMLRDKSITVAKEVLNNHLILYGYEQYYKLLRDSL